MDWKLFAEYYVLLRTLQRLSSCTWSPCMLRCGKRLRNRVKVTESQKRTAIVCSIYSQVLSWQIYKFVVGRSRSRRFRMKVKKLYLSLSQCLLLQLHFLRFGTKPSSSAELDIYPARRTSTGYIYECVDCIPSTNWWSIVLPFHLAQNMQRKF